MIAMTARWFEKDSAEMLIASYLNYTSIAAEGGDDWYPDEVELVARVRQAIEDRGAEDDPVRQADIRLVQKLKPFLNQFIADQRRFADLAPFSIDEKDLKSWWFRLYEIAAGKVGLEELPAYLRPSAGRFLKV